MNVYMPDLGVDEERLERTEDDARERVREPLVYQAHGPYSYFRDSFLAGTDKDEARAAGERLERHGRQMQAIPVETRTVPGTEFEYRVNPNQETGHGLEFTPPLWLVDQFIIQKRPGQVIQRLAKVWDMPAGVSSVNVPKFTTGTAANDQTPGAANENDSNEIETTKVGAQALIYSGNSDWAIQSLEQSPNPGHLDWVIFTDMFAALDASLEKDFITGRGEAFNEALGLLYMTGTNAISVSSSEVKELFEYIGRGIAKVGIERKRTPDAVLLSTARLAWLALAPESEQRPLILTDNVGKDWPPASLAAISVYPDDAITRTWETNLEPIFVCHSQDFMLWNGPLKTMVMEDVLSGSLGVRFVLMRTTATMLHRYPSGISVITGAGTKPASGY